MRSKVDDLGKVSLTVEEDDYTKDKFYYENTLVVDPDLGIAAISLRPVPAGIPLTDKRFWKIITKLEDSVMLNYGKVLNDVRELKQQVKSFLATAEKGNALSNEFGNSEDVGITQKGISEAFSKLWQKISDMEGTEIYGFQLTIDPQFISSDKGTPVTVSCNSDFGPFEMVKIYFNDVLKVDRHNVENFVYEDEISEATEVKAEVQIYGKYLVQTKKIMYYYPLFVGAGNSYLDILTTDYAKEFDGSPQGAYEVTVKTGQRIYVVLSKDADMQIEQIEMNDFNIPMTKTAMENYIVYESKNTYQAGTYTIDINY